MRYLKVLLLVLVFFLVMLFFVDNQAAFTAKFPLTLDLRVIPAFTTATPVPCYFMLLGAFLIGGLLTLAMLLWDRLSLSARLGVSKVRANSLERDVNKAKKQQEKADATIKQLNEQIEALNAEIAALKAAVPATDEAAKA